MGSPPLSKEEISALLKASEQLLTNRYVTISAICLSTYDVLINLDREIEYVWRAGWSISKVFFLFGRYYGLLYNVIAFAMNTRTDLSLEVCKGWLWYDVLGGALLFGPFVNVILTMRLYAVYRNRRVLMIMIILILGEFTLELYTCISLGFQTTRSVMVIPSSMGIVLPGCITQINLHITLLAWIPCMLVATVFFIVTIVKAKSEGCSTPQRLRDIRRISPLIAVIIRDGALLYCTIIVILLISTILCVHAGNVGASAPLPWTIVVYSLTASRLVLNLREEANHRRLGDAVQQSTLGPMVFAMNAVSPTKVVEPSSNTRFGDNDGTLGINRYSYTTEESLETMVFAVNHLSSEGVEISS